MDINGYCTSGALESPLTGDYIVGPAAIQVGENVIEWTEQYTYTYTGGNSIYAQMDYAILRAGASTQSSYVTIPANPRVTLRSNYKPLQTWRHGHQPTLGVFPYGNNAKFFRLVVE